MKRILVGALLMSGCIQTFCSANVQNVAQVEKPIQTDRPLELTEQQKIQCLQQAQIIAYLQDVYSKGKAETLPQKQKKDVFSGALKKGALAGLKCLKVMGGGALGMVLVFGGFVGGSYCIYRFALPLALNKYSNLILHVAKIDVTKIDSGNLPDLGIMDKFWGMILNLFRNKTA